MCHAHNTFDAPETLARSPRTVTAAGSRFTITLAAQSVTALSVRIG